MRYGGRRNSPAITMRGRQDDHAACRLIPALKEPSVGGAAAHALCHVWEGKHVGRGKGAGFCKISVPLPAARRPDFYVIPFPVRRILLPKPWTSHSMPFRAAMSRLAPSPKMPRPGTGRRPRPFGRIFPVPAPASTIVRMRRRDFFMRRDPGPRPDLAVAPPHPCGGPRSDGGSPCRRNSGQNISPGRERIARERHTQDGLLQGDERPCAGNAAAADLACMRWAPVARSARAAIP